MNRKEMLHHIKEQDMEIFDLIAKVIEVIQTHSLWGSEDEYVFKDGETWHRFDPILDIARNVGKTNECDNDLVALPTMETEYE